MALNIAKIQARIPINHFFWLFCSLTLQEVVASKSLDKEYTEDEARVSEKKNNLHNHMKLFMFEHGKYGNKRIQIWEQFWTLYSANQTQRLYIIQAAKHYTVRHFMVNTDNMQTLVTSQQTTNWPHQSHDVIRNSRLRRSIPKMAEN